MEAAATPQTAAAIGALKTYDAHPQAKAASRLDAAAVDFEAVFLTQMMQSMFSGLGDDGPLGGGPGTDAYRSMLADQYGRSVAAAGGVGLADHVRSELLSLQKGS
ncbi:rod-binding protein [Methylopila henanensis]|uniref:Rod-binding protein n=1 Tax=Methylopila henanensis TaxID=873516 RepID=A0ABW4KE99_9HYPH